MSLKIKVPLFIVVTIGVMIGVFYLTIANAILRESSSLEDQKIRDHLGRLQEGLNREFESLETNVGDYAAWDEMYDYVESKDPEFLAENFESESFANLEINLVAVYDNNNELVYMRSYDVAAGEDKEPPPDFENTMPRNIERFSIQELDEERSEFIRFGDQIMFIAAKPIITSDAAGPIRGTLIMGRDFDDHYAEALSRLTKLEAKLIPDVSSANLSNIFGPDASGSSQNLEAIKTVSENEVEGFIAVYDGVGSPVSIIRISMDRSIYALTKKNLSEIFILLIFSGAAVGLLGLAVTHFVVLKRLGKISHALKGFTDKSKNLPDLSISGKDELTAIANTINSAFQELGDSRVAEQRHAEASMREKEKLDVILHSIGDGVIVLDEKRRILLVNKTTEKLSGYSGHELLKGVYNKKIKFVTEKDGKESTDFIDRVYKNGIMTEMRRDIVLVRKDGKTIPVADSAAPIKSMDGKKVVGCIIVFRDVSQEREVDRMKSEFVSIASHQLRTPLTGIKWMVSILTKDQTGKLNDAQKEYLKNIDDSNERMIRLVGDLLDISRLEGTSGKMLEKSKVNLREVLESVLHEQESGAKEKNISFVIAKDWPKSVIIEANRDK
ncbi:MAG TPA: CHASE4 domain-containing protein, partial [Candidatus Gracilibacteria bacterium]|nr:CHASE4 domain-containing protein [Candidatus Gracilibacteria bacterium]